MTKAELITALADKASVTKVEANSLLVALAAVLSEKLSAGEEITLPGVGKLSIAVRSAREGRNPKTGEPVAIPATRVVKFKVASDLKKAVAE